jgi:hypothetical protein
LGYVGPVSEKDLEGIENPDPLLMIPKFQIGKIGTEKWMEDTLRGSAGTKRIEVNAVGRVMRELDREEGDKGQDLRLTIDADIQNFVQARLGDESAACVVMDVTNGRLIRTFLSAGSRKKTIQGFWKTITVHSPIRPCKAFIPPARHSRWSRPWLP